MKLTEATDSIWVTNSQDGEWQGEGPHTVIMIPRSHFLRSKPGGDDYSDTSESRVACTDITVTVQFQ